MKNFLEIDRREFAEAIKTFDVRRLPRSALLAFEGGVISIESGERLVTMRARGEWHGRASFSPNLLKALAQVPPPEDPVVIDYDGTKLRIGTMTVGCDWVQVSKAFLKDAMNPSVLDLLAMDRTLPRSEVHGTTLAKRIKHAHSTLAGNISKAAKLLEDAEISEDDLWALAQRGIRRRLGR